MDYSHHPWLWLMDLRVFGLTLKRKMENINDITYSLYIKLFTMV